jgi:hypothetical protein
MYVQFARKIEVIAVKNERSRKIRILPWWNVDRHLGDSISRIGITRVAKLEKDCHERSVKTGADEQAGRTQRW